MRAASATVYADDALLALGGAVAMVSLLGLLSTRPSGLGRCVLPLYMLCLGLIGLCLVALEVSACGQGGVYTQAALYTPVYPCIQGCRLYRGAGIAVYRGIQGYV